MNLGVVGSRSVLDLNLTWEAIRRFRSVHASVTSIVSGGASGPDTYAIQYAKANGLSFTEHLPDTDMYDKTTALFARNTKIAASCDVLLAVWDGHSKGTLDTIKKAKALGKPVYIAKIGIVSLELSP